MKDRNWYLIKVQADEEEKTVRMIKKELDRRQASIRFEAEESSVPSVRLYEDCFTPVIEQYKKADGKRVVDIKPMFPGYAIIISDHIYDVYEILLNMQQSIKLLGVGDYIQKKNMESHDIFSKIPKTFQSEFFAQPLYKDEVDFLMDFADDNYSISLSKGIVADSQLRITDGPLMGKESLIRKIDRSKKTADIDIYFMGTSTIVKVPLEIMTE